MRFKGLRRFWVALAILPLLGGVALASGPAMFVCRADLVARTACCCPVGERAATAPTQSTPSVSAGCCCDMSQMNAPATPAAEPRLFSQALDHFVLAPIAGTPFVAPAPTVRVRPAAAFAQPPPAIPILLAKQSFLV